jgi:hypothetical protein
MTVLFKRLTLTAGACVLGAALAGCDDIKSALPSVSVEGNVQVTGEQPETFSLALYSWTDNQAAFDTRYCLDAGGDCLGRVDIGDLNNPVTGVTITQTDTSFVISDVPVDVLYVLMVTGADETIRCSTDVIGYDEDTKVVTTSSGIVISGEDGLDTFTLPRAAQIACSAPAEEPEPPEQTEPEETGEVDDAGDITEGEDPVASWTSFQVTDKAGATVYADASAESVVADVECGESFPSVLQIEATAVNAATEQAWIRIQFGSGEDAEYRTVETPITDGAISQSISLTGGFSIIQLDLDEALDGVGESYTVTFCDRDDPPAQEMLTILTWDTDDTDLDTHIYSDSSEVAYYSLSTAWGELDIDDVDGFGPETFSSVPGEVSVHYYSDHGNGDSTATMRVVYYEPESGRICDVTTSQSMSSYEWWTVGTFGPGMTCPE